MAVLADGTLDALDAGGYDVSVDEYSGAVTLSYTMDSADEDGYINGLDVADYDEQQWATAVEVIGREAFDAFHLDSGLLDGSSWVRLGKPCNECEAADAEVHAQFKARNNAEGIRTYGARKA